MPENREKTGRFEPGHSGNPGGRPQGLARTTRELVGADGRAIVEFWMRVMADEAARTADRLAASRLLADRGWGVTPITEPDEPDDTLLRVSQAEVDAAVSTFNEKVRRLAARREQPAVSAHDRDDDVQVEQRVGTPGPS